MEKTGGFFKNIVKGIGLSLIIVLIGILIFALLLNFTSIPSGAIKPINQFIKIISIFLGCYFCAKNSKGFVQGVIIGGTAIILMYFIFSLLGAGNNFGIKIIADIIFGVVFGGISGAIAVNSKRKKR